MLDRLFSLENFGIKLGLENISRLCEALGHPERQFTTLHVAGTNGKGSVTAMVHAALTAAGLRAARYTSPHLTSLAERFVIGDRAVSDAALEATGTDVLALIDRLCAAGTLTVVPTFFEATTAIGFELFRRAGVEAAVIEVGLGGRFDATNVIQPIAGAITTIAFDHQQHLGTSLAAIAFEKAGIIKPGMTVVAGALPEPAMKVVREASAGRGARLVETATASMQVEMVDGRARMTAQTANHTYGPLLLALRGEHQTGNALVAISLLEAAAGSTGSPRSAAASRTPSGRRGWNCSRCPGIDGSSSMRRTTAKERRRSHAICAPGIRKNRCSSSGSCATRMRMTSWSRCCRACPRSLPPRRRPHAPCRPAISRAGSDHERSR